MDVKENNKSGDDNGEVFIYRIKSGALISSYLIVREGVVLYDVVSSWSEAEAIGRDLSYNLKEY